MHIYYNASEIASLIKKNPYKCSDEAFEDLICRVKKQNNLRDVKKFDLIDKEELIQFLELFKNELLIEDKIYKELKVSATNTDKKEELCKISKSLFEKVADKSIKTKTVEKSKDHQKNLEKKIDKIIDTKKKDMKHVKEYVGGFINKQRGIKNEDKIIKKYENDKKTKVTNNNDCLYKKQLFTLKNHNFYVCGKIDGIENDELIEIKNRRNKLFTFMPDYEKVQVEIYLRLTNLKKGRLIQNYNETQSAFDFNLDDKLWNTIITELHTVSLRVLDEIE